MTKPTPEDLDAYQRYLDSLPKDEKGKINAPVDPAAKAHALRELELSAKGGFPVEKDEPGREKTLESWPQGDLFVKDMTEPELVTAIDELKMARATVVKYMQTGNVLGFENKDQAQGTVLLDLEDRSAELPEDLRETISILAKYEFDGETNLYDLPAELEQKIMRFTVSLNHLHKQQT